jgi:predicted anti-sigma-YlaC factor YlaD
MNTTDDGGLAGDGTAADATNACGRIRDLLPLHLLADDASGRLPEVEGHLARCEECRGEARFVTRLLAVRPEPPASLLPAILDRARRPSGVRQARIGPWLLRAAAIAVLALGATAIWQREGATDAVWALALESQPEVDWYGDEWMVAGEPLLEALPDDVLMILVEEMEP